MTLAALLFVAMMTGQGAPEPIAESRRLQAEAMKAYRAGDHALFLDRISAASALRPSHPTLLYYRAAALALNSRDDEALALLARLAAMGMVHDPAKEPEFQRLMSSRRFADIAKLFASNAAPHGAPVVAAKLDATGIIPEGLALDQRRETFYVSSVRNGDIWRVSKSGASRLVSGYPLALMGLAFDARRNVLWAAASGLRQRAGISAENEGRGTLVEIDAATGKILSETSPSDPGRHSLGDVAISHKGQVVVSDGGSQKVYVLRRGRLVPIISRTFTSVQGMAWSPDDRVLYVSDYSEGLLRIDVQARAARVIAEPSNVTLLGIDGIYMAGPQTLIAVQNGTNPNRVIRVDLTGAGEISAVRTIAANLTVMDSPTLGAMAGRRFYVIGNGQWELFGDDGSLKVPAKVLPAVVLEMNVDRTVEDR